VSSKRIILAFNDRAKWPIYITCLFTNLYAGQYITETTERQISWISQGTRHMHRRHEIER
jgi:hypothetical protein